MKPTQPLPLHHSWPLFERGSRFDLGYIHESDRALRAGSVIVPINAEALARQGVGLWECDLSNNALTWSAEVHDVFNLSRDLHLSRIDVVRLYCEESRAAMERLRAYAIKHRRGFTMDAEIRPDQVRHRWMRLTAAPICVGSRVVGLHGLKQDVTHEYL